MNAGYRSSLQRFVVPPATVVNNTDRGYITGMAVNPDRITRKLVSIPDETLQAIDDFRFQQRIRTESEPIRRLIEAGLKAQRPRSAGKRRV